MASFRVYRGRAAGSTVAMCDDREMIARWPCTPPWNLETFSGKISASTGTKEIKKKKKMKNIIMMMT